MLVQVPESQGAGPVVKLNGRVDRLGANEVAQTVSRNGKAAGVRVYVSSNDPGKVKYAATYDLGRAFGERWAARLMPAQLNELMRREPIQTTMRLYVGTDARAKADAAWAADARADAGAFSEVAPRRSPNRAPSGPPLPPTETRRTPKRRKVVIPSEAAGARTQDQRIKSPMLYRLSYSLGDNPTEGSIAGNLARAVAMLLVIAGRHARRVPAWGVVARPSR